ncbi:MAG: bifunctional DNA-formamidopyrimidine glycosylase/DNA-(apurinic or apyrimidinic site) lyase [Neisseriaceae bacterium]|nr:MAG: bifunctional DNA-formamidopyrimidine glycosylase/DNA-(apurinic or apyrimidinic site) lyase [Neisseriaceae bacterium]
MPELPEVETTKNKIMLTLQGQRILRIEVRQPHLRWVVSPQIMRLQNEKVHECSRRGKYIILKLDHGYLVIHLGMTGFFTILEAHIPASKHDHIDVILENGIILRYNDIRRFGSWQWFECLEDCVLIQNLGVEPLSDEFKSDYLFNCFKHKKVACKIAIMDSKIVVGVGNIYASEALFLAKIHPEIPANQLNMQQLDNLVSSIKAVLLKALKEGGTTIKDFKQPDGKIGYFVQQLSVYGRHGEKCYVCGTSITSKVLGQRNSFFCPVCQKK